jgi:hypothetical protein
MTVNLGKDFDTWVNFRVAMAKQDVRVRIEANFDYAWRMRIFKETGMMFFSQEQKRRWNL